MTPNSQAARGVPENGVLHTRRVLLVDDDRDTVVSLMVVLRDEGFDVRGVHDGREALDAIAEFDPDMVVADIAMPGMSGWEFARNVREKFGFRPILVAISGAYMKHTDEVICRVVGFSHFLQKPCDPNRLIQLLGAPAPGKPQGPVR